MCNCPWWLIVGRYCQNETMDAFREHYIGSAQSRKINAEHLTHYSWIHMFLQMECNFQKCQLCMSHKYWKHMLIFGSSLGKPWLLKWALNLNLNAHRWVTPQQWWECGPREMAHGERSQRLTEGKAAGGEGSSWRHFGACRKAEDGSRPQAVGGAGPQDRMGLTQTLGPSQEPCRTAWGMLEPVIPSFPNQLLCWPGL